MATHRWALSRPARPHAYVLYLLRPFALPPQPYTCPSLFGGVMKDDMLSLKLSRTTLPTEKLIPLSGLTV
jgi:hypothetical protein